MTETPERGQQLGETPEGEVLAEEREGYAPPPAYRLEDEQDPEAADEESLS